MNYAEEYRKLHENPKHFRGLTTLRHAKDIGELIQLYEARTVLDVGAGKGHQFSQHRIHEQWGVEFPTCYDPGVAEFSEKPTGKFDAVLCIDVLEHIEEADLTAFLQELMGFAKPQGFIFLAICCRHSRKKLPDGRSVHVTVRPPAWWFDLFRSTWGMDGNWPAGVAAVFDENEPGKGNRF